MDISDTIIRRIDNITYLLDLLRNEVEESIIASLDDYGMAPREKLDIEDITEEDGKVIEGFHVLINDDNDISIEFRDGRTLPLSVFETDNMYDIFVRIHSKMLDEFSSH
ncbi:MAG TPA: hypothetical protein ENN21_03865 [Spirochaetes bacterium]|nr:hypothetical protein [Spirochaetota bacterium]